MFFVPQFMCLHLYTYITLHYTKQYSYLEIPGVTWLLLLSVCVSAAVSVVTIETISFKMQYAVKLLG
jgi:hypothetical protein